ncbi:hypothetical protein [Pseudobacteriovorax antillogorgiicola]|uniref:Uncharacterized protein n=1 Tax=Pseudobacteriovorax antillogorgiicola TaxID=1513793 RepID=A0A1Y6BGZ8_9BACT|nr:hypothetical protein [Pseudobacteriovorax antillogorgiicola]TCS56313.1 hypothetical protein EDD56_104135 [Pseudobacteriovorax antillogorgiicola]SMF07183.1 hypothetical protein SAMN06296036_104198 [Pseudobacteriovorax antillogorgiicola]
MFMRIFTILWMLGFSASCTDQDFSSNPKENQEPLQSEDLLESDDSEAANIPQPISGAYLACAELQSPSDTNELAHVGCWISDGNGQRINVSSSYSIQWQLALDENLSVDQSTVVYEEGSSPWHVSYYLSSIVAGTVSQALASMRVIALVSDSAGKALGSMVSTYESAKDRSPQAQATAYRFYRIEIFEMKQACETNTVGIEGLALSWNGTFQEDTFAGLPDTPDPQANIGFVGNEQVSLSSSPTFTDFYPYEAFGGGFGGGWWSAQDSFEASTPAPATTQVYFQIEFIGDQGVLLDALTINGGSISDFGQGVDYSQCSPSHFQIQSSQDGQSWTVLKDIKADTTEPFTLKF